jgi:hypothetical protein
MILRKRTVNTHFYTTEPKENQILKKHVFAHAKGFIETYYTDKNGNKQGLYTLVLRCTKQLMYQSFYVDNKKIGIENFYDKHGNFTHSNFA